MEKKEYPKEPQSTEDAVFCFLRRDDDAALSFLRKNRNEVGEFCLQVKEELGDRAEPQLTEFIKLLIEPTK